jgi:hypothetical protein
MNLNPQIREYLYNFILSLDGAGIIITDLDDINQSLQEMDEDFDFFALKEIFDTVSE